MAIVAHDAPDGGIHYVVSGKGTKFPQSEGLAGGFPGAVNDYVWVKAPTTGANADPFAQSLSDMAGGRVPVSWGVFPVIGLDALYVRWHGGGGIGEPLERDSEAVAHDVVDRTISSEAAAQV